MPYQPLKEDIAVLGCLIHEDSTQSIAQFTSLNINVVRDIVFLLFHHRYIKLAGNFTYFRKDEIDDLLFIITAKGFNELEQK